MDLDHVDRLDSRCALCDRANEIGPETMAVDWVQRSSGTRLYVCERHAEDLARFDTSMEDLPETPQADVCTGCAKLTLKADMSGMRLCRSCGTEGTTEALREASRREGNMSFAEAVDLLEDLVSEDEDVTPEEAAEAVERWSGMPMTPREEPMDETDEASETEANGGEE